MMKRKSLTVAIVSALTLAVGAFFTACAQGEAPHTKHYDLNADGICDVCKNDMDGHTHIFNIKWESDETHHWHKATCAHADEKGNYEEHTFANGICSACGKFDSAPVKPVNGVYHFQAEFAELNDNGAGNGHTMVLEYDRHEFTESGKTDGPLVTDVGYFGGQSDNIGQTITWKFTSDKAATVKLTLRIASAVGSWSDKKIDPIDLGAEGAPSLKVNNSDVDLTGKELKGLSGLTQEDMQSGVAYSNFTEVEITVNLVAGDNTVVLTSGAKGCNPDKIMITTDAVLTFVNTDNSARG